jgi:Family of unknown function (DUF5989)
MRHALRLTRELGAYTVVNRAWALPPLVLLLGLVTLLVVAAQSAAPLTLYTLF